jgi:hypothetical protein
MTMLDELLDELRRRSWPEPIVDSRARHWMYWLGPRARSLIVVEVIGELIVSYRHCFSVWKSALEAADELDRQRARLAPGELPILDPVGPSGVREVTIDGVRIAGPPS